MKKNFIFLAATGLAVAMLAASISCLCLKTEVTPIALKPIEVQKDNLTIRINPSTEALLIAYRLADYSFFAENNAESNAYVKAVDSLMQDQKNHAFIKMLRGYTKDYKGSEIPLLQIGRYISDDFTQLAFTKKTMPKELSQFWGKLDTQRFVFLFNDFVRSSDFQNIWNDYEKYLQADLDDVVDFYDKNPQLIQWCNEYFFNSFYGKNEFLVQVSPFMNGHYSVAPYYKEDEKKVVPIFQSPGLQKENGSTDINLCIAISETMMLSFITNNYENVGAPLENIMKRFAEAKTEDNNVSQYDFITFAANYLSYFPAMLYSKKCLNEEIAKQRIESLKQNFISDDLLIIEAVFKYYQRHRDIYPYFELFFYSYFTNYLNVMKFG